MQLLADKIYKETTEKLQQENFRPQSLLNNYNVEMLGTTDDPTDDLKFSSEYTDNKIKK